MSDGPRPISVVHLLAPTRFGGLETVVITLTPALARLGANVAVVLVVTPDEDLTDGHPVATELERSGVDVRTLVLPAKAYGAERRAVRSILTETGADVLHTHGFRPDIADAPVARKMGVATVSTIHGRTATSLKGRFYEWVQDRALRRFGAVIAVSEKLRGGLCDAGVPPDRIHLLPNAWAPSTEPLSRIDAREALGLPADGPVVGWIGRMGSEKAPDVMVRAAGLVETAGVTFSMVGDGPLRGEAERVAAEVGVGEQVVWHGAVANAGRMVKGFDVVVLSSWTEGTPMVLLEAMYARVPVVTTAVGGVPDVVSEEQAHLCEAGDPAGIAKAIDEVLSNPEDAARRADSARTRLDRDFAVEPWARRHLEIYEELTERR